MREIRPVQTERELEDFTGLQMNAYPAIPTPFTERLEHLRRLHDSDDTSSLWGMWDAGDMIAGGRLLDFSMNYMGTFIRAGGIGALAVGLTHKKRGAARDFMRFFLDRCQERRQVVALLYPFRPDFYYRMGFGYGTKMNRYRFEPRSLPLSGQPGRIRLLTEDDADRIRACHDAYAARHHGWCTLSLYELKGLLHRYGGGRLVGYPEDGDLDGYMTFDFKRAHDSNFVMNDLVLRHWIWNTPRALAALCGFLHRQQDQFSRIEYCTQDAGFHHLLRDVRNDTGNMLPGVAHETNIAGVGLMYRIVSITNFLDAVEFDFGGVGLDPVRGGYAASGRFRHLPVGHGAGWSEVPRLFADEHGRLVVAANGQRAAQNSP
ncbi:MAG: GNAT family N-acetyltransferase [Bacillota bacterium]